MKLLLFIGIFKSIVYSIVCIALASTKSYTGELGELQSEILLHMVGCAAESETVNHIAKYLHRAQPTIFKSIKLLLESNYVMAQQKYKRGPKVLNLTDKGAAAAIIAGADLKQFDNYLKKQPTDLIAEGLKYVESMATNPEKRSFMLQKAMDHALKNNLFEQGHMRKMTEEEGKMFIRYIIVEYMKSLGPASNIKTAEQFLDRYGLEKNFLKSFLIQQKQAIDALLKKLESG
jgi:predicted transcriptional regulator